MKNLYNKIYINIKYYYCLIIAISLKLVITYIPSKLVVPELAYNKLVPNKIKQELKPPNKKYVRPPVVANSEFLYNVLSKYNP